jgi:branched-chain amino acid transport system substrate-binding protein
MKLKTQVGLACAVVAALALTACGSDAKSSPPATAATSGSPTTVAATTGSPTPTTQASGTKGSDTTTGSTGAATGDPIVVGSICACTGTFAAQFGQGADISQAWADSVNASGGINGHPVKMIVKDDGGDPTKALTAAKELVEEDKVVAIVGDVTTTVDGWQDYVQQKGVPVISYIGSEASYSNPDFFPVGPGITEFWGAVAAQAAAAGHKEIGNPYCAEAPVCAQVSGIIKAYGPQLGVGVSSAAVSASQTSFAAPCLQMKNDGVDAMVITLDPFTGASFLDECARQGLTAPLYNQSTGYDPSWLGDKRYDGLNLVSYVANHLDTSIPGVKEMHDDLAKYSSVDPAKMTYESYAAWVTGKVFEIAAKAGNLGPTSTPDDVKKALYGLKDETTGGLTVPLNYKEGQPSVFTCHFIITVQGDKLVSENNAQPECLSPELAAITMKLSQK